MQWNDSVITVKGIGEKTAKNLQKMGIYTVADLVEHYPREYKLFDYPVYIDQLQAEQTQAVEAIVNSTPELKRSGNRQIVSCRIRDPKGTMTLIWYNQPYIKQQLRMGTRYVFRGRIVWRKNELAMEQPALYTVMDYRKLMHVLQPVYPLTEGVTNHLISKAVATAIRELDFPEDYLPAGSKRKYSLMGRQAAIQEVHFPKSEEMMREGRKRLIFDEFFLFLISVRAIKEEQGKEKTPYTMQPSKDCHRLISGLPYELTGAQKKVWMEVEQDLTGEHAMNRLIQGDVGSGKTILSVLALLMTAKNGYQGCLMVPTEVLARQHYRTIQSVLQPFGLRIELLTGSMTAAQKRAAYQRIETHEADVIVGTHALIQEKVIYDSLALVITDEQHRFGVRQRAELLQKGKQPHVLVMSATPIPRTLSLILYGDLSVSILDELPASRLPIKNCVVPTSYRPTAYKFIEKQVSMGHQAFVICPMVDESDEIEAEAVTEYSDTLKEALDSKITIEYLHGKMKPKEKNEIMDRFANGTINVLVSTTVVEVGVDVPNATVMLIENSERFGLAQLHQLRGRVGRGNAQAYCIMITSSAKKETRERLDIMNRSNDGFVIAEEDLKLRGPGDIFGIRQSGELEFSLADIYRDAALLTQAGEAVQELPEAEYQQIVKLSFCSAPII